MVTGKKDVKNKLLSGASVENSISDDDLGHIIRLSLAGQTEELRLFIARLVQKYRNIHPNLSEKLNEYLRSTSHKHSMMRKNNYDAVVFPRTPSDEDTKLSLLKSFDESVNDLTPLFSEQLKVKLEQLIKERNFSEKLKNKGLSPARSAIFTGPPGVGKTLAARWIAAQLAVPLYVLDLTTVMSSLLGKTGANLRSVLDFAKTKPCVLLLDEIDSIAKRRSDDTDIGELKRLVTIMLQEIDNWSGDSLLLAATNYPELLDPALWRRFDVIIEFTLPNYREIDYAITLFSGNDFNIISKWKPILEIIYKDKSFSDIERGIYQLRRINALGDSSLGETIKDLFKSSAYNLSKNESKDIAVNLAKQKLLSIRAIAELTGVSRDTISKYLKADDVNEENL